MWITTRSKDEDIFVELLDSAVVSDRPSTRPCFHSQIDARINNDNIVEGENIGS
jgi:hypothetical protein